MSPQNLYDDETFFKKYSEFPRAIKGETGASEWPELLRMLPSDLHNKRVLDLACGEGWFARWCISQGSREVDACDISINMLRKAESRTKTPKSDAEKCAAAAGCSPEPLMPSRNGTSLINFSRVDLEKLQLSAARGYDLVFCGLALHYVKNIANVMHEVHKSLAPGGVFVFSIEHPFLTAPTRPGFIKTADGEVDQWPVDSYFEEGERSITWLVRDVKKQHRTLSSYFALLAGAGFEVLDMNEWGATEQKSRKHPDWVEGVCPRFLLMTARKRDERPMSRSWAHCR